MTTDQGTLFDNPYTVTSDDPDRDQAWTELCVGLAVRSWTAGDFQGFYAMFLHGWDARQNLQYRRDGIRINAEMDAEIAQAETTAVAGKAQLSSSADSGREGG